MEGLDSVDVALLRALQNNAKHTIKELSEIVNLSTSPVYERVKRLEQDGYIKGYVAVLDAEKLGRDLIVFSNIKLKQHSKNIGNEFVADILKLDEVVECYNVSGDYDFLLKVQVRDMKHYQDFVFNRLGAVDSIGSTHSTFVMAEVKNLHGVVL